MNVAARVCRSPDSWLWTDHSQISLTHSPTPPKCSTRAIMALINNLGIVYHQYCSSSELAEILGDASVHPYHYAIVEAVEPFKLHITSMSYLYEVFEHLQLLCIDIWMHIHSVTITDTSPGLGELTESLGDARVQTIPLSYS